jgi:hypothetical protein
MISASIQDPIASLVFARNEAPFGSTGGGAHQSAATSETMLAATSDDRRRRRQDTGFTALVTFIAATGLPQHPTRRSTSPSTVPGTISRRPSC